MAKKRSKKKAAKAVVPFAAAATSDDKDVIAEAYKDELKIVFHGFFNKLIGKVPTADADFADGLATLRDARDRALKLI